MNREEETRGCGTLPSSGRWPCSGLACLFSMVSSIEIWLIAILSLAYWQADRAEQTGPDRRGMGDRRKHGPGVTALRSTGIAQPLTHLPPRTHPDLTPPRVCGGLWEGRAQDAIGTQRQG